MVTNLAESEDTANPIYLKVLW